MRITTHPIFGEIEHGKKITIYLGKEPIDAYENDTVASALWAAGRRVCRYSPQKCQPRGIFCAIGYCSDCLMVVNGNPNTRTCIASVSEGMIVEIQQGNGNWEKVYE